MRVLVDGEDRTEIEEETQAPRHSADQQDCGFQVIHICDETGDDRREGRTRVLNEIFRGLRGRANFRNGNIIHCGDHVRGGQRHEYGRETHENKELILCLDRGGDGEVHE